MTDERLCKCGHVLSTHDRDTPSGPMCGMCKCALFEAAPSTDEGEARKGHECDAWCVFQSWVSEIRGGASNTDDLGLRSAFDAIAAEAREPLEERIRELEAELNGTVETYVETTGDMGAEVLELRAEVDTLRKALRRIVEYREGTDQPHEVHVLWSIARRALATLPSSTEDTNTLKANFDGCPFCGGDDSVGIHRIGRCEDTKES